MHLSRLSAFSAMGILIFLLLGCANAVKSSDGKNYEECYPLVDRLEREIQKNLEKETTIRPVEVLKGRFCVISPVTTDMLMVPIIGPMVVAANNRTMTISFTARLGDKIISAEERSNAEKAFANDSELFNRVVKKALSSNK